MPIQMNLTDPDTGVECPESYWTIDELHFIPRLNTSHVKLAGYYDAATAADLDKRPFAYQECDIIQDPLDTEITVGNAIAGVYTYCLAALPFFATGEIV